MKCVFSKSVLAIGSALLVAACSGTASTPADAPRAAKAPAPTEQAKRLSGLLLGDWKGNGSLTAEGKTAPIEVQLRCAEASSGWGVGCQVTATDAGGAFHHETHLWGYSADGAKVHLFTVTTDGETHDHAGAFTDKGVALQYAGSMGDKPFVESLSVESAGASKLHFRNNASVAGAPAFALDVTFQK